MQLDAPTYGGKRAVATASRRPEAVVIGRSLSRGGTALGRDYPDRPCEALGRLRRLVRRVQPTVAPQVASTLLLSASALTFRGVLASSTSLALPVATCVLAAATLFLVGGVLVAQRTLRQTRTAAELEAYVDLLRPYRNPTLRLARARIYDLPKAEPVQGLDQLVEGHRREDVESVSHYLDTIGTLVGRGLLDIRPAALSLRQEGLPDEVSASCPIRGRVHDREARAALPTLLVRPGGFAVRCAGNFAREPR